MIFSATLFFAVIVALVIYSFAKNARYFYLLLKLPTNKTIPFFGNAHNFIFRKRDFGPMFIEILAPIFPKSIVCLWMFHKPIIMITRADAAEVLLSSNHQLKKANMYTMLHSWLGEGLLTSAGSKWRSHRKLITPSFHFNVLENFMPIFNEQSEILVQRLMSKADNKKFDILPYINLCTLDVICETAMGSSINAQSNTDSKYVQAISSMSNIIVQRNFKVWLQNPLIFKLSWYGREEKRSLKILHDFTNKVISERMKVCEMNKKERASNGQDEQDTSYAYGQKKRMVFLDTLLEATADGVRLTPEEIREEVDTFMFEGHDTTTTGIGWVIHSMGWLPSLQEKVHEELDRVFGDSDRAVTKEDLMELKCLEATIKEVMRLTPPVHTFGRQLLEDTVIAGYTIPKGTDVFINPFAVHSDPKIHPNPLIFDPTRFFTEDWQRRHPYGYIPFSAGPRNCIGQKFALMEEKVVLSHFFRKFRVKVSIPIEQLNAGGDLVLKPKDGIPVYMELRR